MIKNQPICPNDISPTDFISFLELLREEGFNCKVTSEEHVANVYREDFDDTYISLLNGRIVSIWPIPGFTMIRIKKSEKWLFYVDI